jgi:hypothetical protein
MIGHEKAISLILARRDLVSASRSLLVGLSGIAGIG